MNTVNLNAIRERIRQVKGELARLKMLERLARLQAKSVAHRKGDANDR